ncbi:hypothetical protein EDB89DRAFT_2125817 [Lactarius sanguifluus]|nr:hypothetical protein EDB89DRAFT_2125817 [Lactarius sanguifluus]
MSRYYDDDEDDNPYAPRIGPAAMPSPRSKFAPYYSGHANTFEDFLEEFEGLASDCELMDPQRVDVLICYIAPSLHDFWRSLSGYHSCDWPLFRQSLVNIFGNTTPRHQILRQKLHSYIQDSSRRRMFCEDDVLRYYRQFICFGLPLVHAGHLSGEERDAAFWYGFHPDDRQILQPRLLGKNHFQPPDIPFHFEDVLGCARAAFAYEDSFLPWLHAKQFKPPIVRREQHIVEPAPRDAHSCRAVTRAVATYAETTPNELSPSSHSTPDTQLPSSSSPSALESQHGLAHSATLDQPEPEPEHTLSTTLQPSASFPTSFHTHSLAPSAAADAHEIPSTSSPTLAPFSMPISSDFKYLPSATVHQPAPTLLSTPPSSSVSSTLLPSPVSIRSEMNSQPEPALASEHPIPPSIDDVPKITSMPHSSSLVELTKFECLSPATEDQSKPESTPMLFASVPMLTFTPLHVHSATDSDPLFTSTPPASSPTLSMSSAVDCQPEFEPEHVPLYLSTPTPPSLPAPSLALEFTDDDRALSSLPLPEMSTLDSLPLILSPDQSSSSSSSGSLSQLSRPCELESSTLVSAVDIVPLSQPEPPWSSPCEPIPFLPVSLEAPPNATISPHLTLPQRPPGLKTIGSVSTRLEVTPATPFVSQSQQPPLDFEVSSTLGPRFQLTSPPLPPSRSGLACFNFTFALVTTAALVSTLINVSAALLTYTRKFWSKQDTSDIRIDTLKASSCDAPFMYRLQLGQYTPRASRFVFDPGGLASVFRLTEDACKPKSKTCGIFIPCTTLDTGLPHSRSIDNLIVFDPGGVGFTTRRCLQAQALVFDDFFFMHDAYLSQYRFSSCSLRFRL